MLIIATMQKKQHAPQILLPYVQQVLMLNLMRHHVAEHVSPLLVTLQQEQQHVQQIILRPV